LVRAVFIAVHPVREIHEILQHYPPNCQPTRVARLGFAGGMSGAQFWRLTAPRGELALRRWPTEHPAPQRLRFIHAVLAHAESRGITCLPLPITTRKGQSFVEHAGHLWEIAPWMPGRADYERAPSDAKLCAAMTNLAQIHLALADFPIDATRQAAGAPPSVMRRLARLRELSSGGLQQLSGAVTDHHWSDLAPLARQFLALLTVGMPHAIAQLEPLAQVTVSLQPCLRDIWHDHVLFIGRKVTGMVDFGAIDIDTPACDIARLLVSLVGNDQTGWQTGIAAYIAVRPCSADELSAISALDIGGTLLAGCNWIRWIYVEGRQFENPTQVINRFRAIVARAAKPRSG
jgi:Ser/Thr protein kinase RdoA (MazF antagonist)